MLQVHETPTYTQQIASAPAGPDEPGQLILRCVGRLRGKGGFDHTQVPGCFAIHLLTQGAGELITRGRRFRLDPGDVFLPVVGRVNRYRQDPAGPWEYLWLRLEGSQARWAMLQVGLGAENPVRRGPVDDRLKPEAEAMLRTFGDDSAPPLKAVTAAWRLIDLLGPAPTNHEPPRPRTPDQVARMARVLLEQHYQSDVSIRALARSLGVQRSTLFRHFRRATGLSPQQYVQRLRMRQARMLLAEGDLSVKQVAYACGFSDARYFSRRFRAAHGVPPSRYARSNTAPAD